MIIEQTEADARAEAQRAQRSAQYDWWHAEYVKAEQEHAKRPPTPAELNGLPTSKRHFAPRWHAGGDETCPVPGEKISVWRGPYAYVHGCPAPVATRGWWVACAAHSHDWTKPTLYRVFKQVTG